MENEKLVMITSANAVFSYKKENPSAESEEIIKYLMKSLDAGKQEKICAVAAADFLLKYLEKNPRAGEKEAIQHVMDNITEIVSSVNEQKEGE
ncbi:hypothetical protein HYW76_02675 [Candidatus Pacearchaeota archaeon]|nr:hypothetical protein [Candidatus Pacearchaeota archaeon]